MTSYFRNVACVEDLKAEYCRLAKLYHPDMGGDTETMQAVNAEYETLFARYKNIHRSINKDSEQEYYEKETTECPADFIGVVTALMKYPNVEIELCGRWLWIHGETRPIKGDLLALGCRYSANKQAWSWHYAKDDVKQYKGRKAWNMEQIRSSYGSAYVKVTDKALLTD